MRQTTFRSLVLFAACAAASGQTAFTIDTVAGSGRLPFAGGLVSEVRLVQPNHLAADGQGNIYFTDEYCLCVLRLSQDGMISRFAGNSEDGFSGDDGPAVEARLRSPRGLAVSATGEVYIADAANGRIRKVALDGTISSIAGGGPLPAAGDGGPALGAAIGNPSHLVFDAEGNLYFSDTFNHLVRRISAADGTISTYAGTGQLGFTGDRGPANQARLSRPQGLAFDSKGNLYITDTTNQRIRRVTPDGTINTFAGVSQSGFNGDNGPAANAVLFSPSDVAVGPGDEVYIADTSNGRIRRVGSDGIIRTIAGGGRNTALDPGPAINAALAAVNGVKLDGQGNLLFSESSRRRIRTMNLADGTLRFLAGVPWLTSPGDGEAATSGVLLQPAGVGMDGAGNLYIADSLDHRVRKVEPEFGTITTFAGIGVPGSTGDGGDALEAAVGGAGSIAVDSMGDVYTTSGGTRIRRINSTGGITTYAGGATVGFGGDELPAVSAVLNFPAGLAFDPDDNLYVADTANHRIRKIVRSTGVIVTVAGNGTAGSAGDGESALRANLSSPEGVLYDSATGNIYIADTANQKVRRVTPDGLISTVAGTGVIGIGPDNVAATASRLSGPVGLAIDEAGHLYISHRGNAQIRRVNAETGIISTVAGTTVLGFSGDGGDATKAQLAAPGQMLRTPDGRIFFTDGRNLRVRVLTPKQVEPE